MKTLYRLTALVLSVVLVLCLFGCAQRPKFFTDGYSKAEQEDKYTSIYADYPSVDGYTPINRSEYYCYNKLNDTQKEIYNGIRELAEKLSYEYIFFKNVTKRDIAIAYNAFNDDFPQFFWINNSYTFAEKGDEIGFSFDADEGFLAVDSVEERDELNKRVNDKVEEILTTVITPQMSDYEKELKIHDYICENMVYNKEVLQKTERTEEEMNNWSILGGLLDETGVCESYSKIFQLLMYNIGIPCTSVSGTTDESHMWNAVKIDGNWCYVDVTWDDAEAGTLEYTHCCLNMNDTVLKLHHDAYDNDLEGISLNSIEKGQFNFFDEKTSDKYYYYKQENRVITKQNFASIVPELLKKEWNGKKASVELCVASGTVNNTNLYEMIGDLDIFEGINGAKSLIYIRLPNNNALVLMVSNE